MKEIIEMNEYKEIYNKIKDRIQINDEEYKDFDKILKELNINKNDL